MLFHILFLVFNETVFFAMLSVCLTDVNFDNHSPNVSESVWLIGAGPDGVEEIKRHRFFASIDWIVSTIHEEYSVLYMILSCAVLLFLQGRTLFAVLLLIGIIHKLYRHTVH